MSLLKIIKAQLGISSTPTNNFTLDASAQDGTMKLSRGNAGATTQDVMMVGADGKVTFPAGSQMLGVGQTWKNVKPSRSLGVQYTNNSGKPIQANVFVAPTAASWAYDAYIDNVRVAYGRSDNANGLQLTVSLTVPNGSLYNVNVVNCTLQDWVELR